jgi:hypothetical protein
MRPIIFGRENPSRGEGSKLYASPSERNDGDVMRRE